MRPQGRRTWLWLWPEVFCLCLPHHGPTSVCVCASRGRTRSRFARNRTSMYQRISPVYKSEKLTSRIPGGGAKMAPKGEDDVGRRQLVTSAASYRCCPYRGTCKPALSLAFMILFLISLPYDLGEPLYIRIKWTLAFKTSLKVFKCFAHLTGFSLFFTFLSSLSH